MTASESLDHGGFAGLFIERVIIRNFRGVEFCEVEFEPDLTLLVGRNNIGKSRILSAIQLGVGGRPADVDDFTVGQENDPGIDIVLSPNRPVVGREEAFDSALAPRFRTGIQTTSEEPFRERFAWRTHVRHSAEGLGARSESRVLTFDSVAGVWAEPESAAELSREVRATIAVDLIGTGRDLVEELGRRGTSVRKVLSNLEVVEDVRLDLERKLAELGSEIMTGSRTLASMRDALGQLHALIGTMGAPSLSPIPIRLEELSRSISIDLDSGRGALPMRMHGAGSRSLASLQVQGVLYERRLGLDGPRLRPHPLTLIEEPEAHLHPQASMELESLLLALRGQKIVSTHSPQLVSIVEPRCIRVLPDNGPRVRIVDLGPADSSASASHRALRPDLHASEMEKLKRSVERPFGELLFASAVVIGDGATERAFLPPVLRHALKMRAHGVCVIDPEGMNGEHANAAVKFSSLVKIPWLLFADGDTAGKQAAEALVGTHASGDASRIIWAMGTDSDGEPIGGAIEALLSEFDEELCRAACAEVRPSISSSAPIKRVMGQVKGSVGSTLARHFLDKYRAVTDWPAPLQELVERLEMELK